MVKKMKKRIISGNGKSYMRLSKSDARKSFERGIRLYVMAIDRDPISSLTSPHLYYKGCKSIRGYYNGKPEISSFDDLLSDFSEWLYCDGYGHIPQRYDANHYRFSYWIELVS